MKLLEYVFTKQQIRDKFFWFRLGLAIVMMGVLISQLFTFEDFYEVLTVAHGNLGVGSIVMILVLLPIYELGSVPSLLSMDLSKQFIRASAYVARSVSLLLVALSINGLVVAPGESTALLGATIGLPAHILTTLGLIGYAAAIWFATRNQLVEAPTKK